MKLDLIAISKLSPPGLLDLRDLAAMIVTLQKLVCMPIGTPAHGRLYGRILAQFLRQLHQGKRDNFHLRVKAWVMQCPRRIAFVRKVIGEPAIKRWRTNRLLDYALSQKCKDWQVVFKDGLDGFAALIGKNAPTSHPSKPGLRKSGTYNWKPFALNKIPNAVRILSGSTGEVTQTSFPRLRGKCRSEAEAMGGTSFVWRKALACPPTPPAGYAFASRGICPALAQTHAWGKEDSDIPTTNTPHRPKRKFPPVRFHPDELRPEAATGKPTEQAPEIGLETQPKKLANKQPEIPPPPKPKVENANQSPKSPEKYLEQNPP